MITQSSDPLSLIDRVQTLNGALRQAIEAIETLGDLEIDKYPSEQTRAQYVREQLAAARTALRG